MPDSLHRAETGAWKGVLRTLGLAGGADHAGVYGHDADRVAAALRAAHPKAVVRTGETAPGDGAEITGLGLVVLLHAWHPLRRLDALARDIASRLAPGATLVLGDLNVPRLRRSVEGMYPAARLYRRHPEIAGWLESRTATPTQLDTATIRAGLDGIRGAVVDLPLAVHADQEAFRRSVAAGRWRGFDRLDQAQRDDLLAGLRTPPGPIWPWTEVEPWYLVAGTRRTVDG